MADERFGVGAAFGVQDVRGFPELVKRVEEVEHERDVLEGADDAALQRAFAVGHDHPGSLVVGVAAGHLGLDVVDERVLGGGQARPYPLVAGLWALGALLLGVGVKEAVDDVLGGSHDRRLAVDGGDGRHPLLVGLLALASAHDPQRAFGLDHRDALAVDRADEDLAGGCCDRGAGAGGVELSKSTAASRTICSAERLGTVVPVISQTSAIASSKGPQTTARTSRRWHS